MYPAIADNMPRLPPSRLWGVHQPVMSPRVGLSGPLAARLTGSQAHHSCLISRSSFSIPYPNCGWGHGGTQNKSTSRSVQTCPEMVCQVFWTLILLFRMVVQDWQSMTIPDVATQLYRP